MEITCVPFFSKILFLFPDDPDIRKTERPPTFVTRVGTPGRTPALFDKCTWFFYMRNKTHVTIGFTSHPKDEAMVKCLA